jgi:hypothetical protein
MQCCQMYGNCRICTVFELWYDNVYGNEFYTIMYEFYTIYTNFIR